MRVTTAEFLRDYGALAEGAMAEPVTITEDGEDRFVLLTVEAYRRLCRGDRRVFGVEELTEAEIAMIEAAEVPAGYAHLDAELEDDQRR